MTQMGQVGEEGMTARGAGRRSDTEEARAKVQIDNERFAGVVWSFIHMSFTV